MVSSASYYFNSFPEQSCLSKQNKKKSAIVIYPFSGERNFPGLISHSLQLVLPISFGLGKCGTLDGEGGINTFWPRGFGTQTLSKPLWEHGIKQALLPSEGQAAWWRAARSTGLAWRPEHARSPSHERPPWEARGWPWIPTPEGLVLDPHPDSRHSPNSPPSPEPPLTRCAKVSPGASTSPAAPPNSAAPSPRELGARSRGAARTLCTGCGWRGGQGSAAGPTAGAGSAAGGDSGARAGVAIFPEERGFFEPNGVFWKCRKRTEPGAGGAQGSAQGRKLHHRRLGFGGLSLGVCLLLSWLFHCALRKYGTPTPKTY